MSVPENCANCRRYLHENEQGDTYCILCKWCPECGHNRNLHGLCPKHDCTVQDVERLRKHVTLLEQMVAIGSACIGGDCEGLWEDKRDGMTAARFWELDEQWQQLDPITLRAQE